MPKACASSPEWIHATLRSRGRASSIKNLEIPLPRSFILLVKWVQTVCSTNNMILPCPSPSILFIYSLCFPLVRSLVCSEEIYGNPKIEDCERVLLEIPFARQSFSSRQSQYQHVFAEPQFLEPPFAQVINMYRPRAIIQLPKVWKSSKSLSLITNLQSNLAQLAEPRLQTPAA